MIKYGIKIWSINKERFQPAVDLYKQNRIDFGEIYLVPSAVPLENLEVLKQMPFELHAPHFTHKFNLMELDDRQLQIFKNQVIKTADFLNSQFIVVHPGIGDSKEIFKKNSAKIFDKRVLIETMAVIGFVGQGGNKIDEGVVCFGHSQEQLQFINKECGFGICLDLAHSIAAAVSVGVDYKDFLMSLINSLQPIYFHISGGYENSEEDEHLNIFDGNLDIKWIKKTLLNYSKDKDIYLVFETPKTGNGLENDIKNIDYFRTLEI